MQLNMIWTTCPDYEESFHRWVTALEPGAFFAERVQNISIYNVDIDIFCTRSAGRAVGSRAIARHR